MTATLGVVDAVLDAAEAFAGAPADARLRAALQAEIRRGMGIGNAAMLGVSQWLWFGFLHVARARLEARDPAQTAELAGALARLVAAIRRGRSPQQAIAPAAGDAA